MFWLWLTKTDKELNHADICFVSGRKIAVDWALPKDKFEAKQGKNF